MFSNLSKRTGHSKGLSLIFLLVALFLVVTPLAGLNVVNPEGAKANPARGSIDIFKFLDQDNDGTHDDAEPGLQGWVFTVSGVPGTFTTGADGHVVVPDLDAGTYNVTETVKSGFSFDIFVFTRYMVDEIKWSPGADNVWRPENIGRSFYPGVEAGGRARIFKNIWVSAGSSFIYSFVLQSDSADYTLRDDKRVPHVPVFSLDAGVEYTGAKSLFTLNGQYVSKQYTYWPTPQSSVDGYFVMNAGYTRKLSEVFSIKLAIDNLLNARYETADGYPMPPFFIRSGVEAVF